MNRASGLLQLTSCLTLFLISCGGEKYDFSRPSYGWLKIETNQSGAVVFIDEKKFQLLTPCTITLTFGKHDVRIERQRYYNEYREVDIAQNETMALSVELSSALYPYDGDWTAETYPAAVPQEEFLFSLHLVVIDNLIIGS